MSHLTKQEREKYIKMFLGVDSNGDGCLNMPEVGALCSALGYRMSRSRIVALFNSLDTDKNSKVTLDEFLAAMPSIAPTERKCANIRRLFRSLDTNKDGVLSVDELSRVMATADTPLSREETMQLIAQVDRNGDNKLDYEEFVELMETSSAR
ncbi:calmodulin-like protein 5 [Haliotis cracherodii]|uniref:calmodulin-like protein 5 n=1 Tax=Haliotis cracherodii TaxID=6455 RepID=UPI0039ED16FC